MEGILGKKLGMTQIFARGRHGDAGDGDRRPGPAWSCSARPRPSTATRRCSSAASRTKPPKHVTKPAQGHFKKAGVAPVRRLGEFRLDAGRGRQGRRRGQGLDLRADEYVDVVGTSKGKGFQGVIKRHNFRGGRATHGSMFHRAPGSIGASSVPVARLPGMRAAGRMGGKRVTVKNLQRGQGRRRART